MLRKGLCALSLTALCGLWLPQPASAADAVTAAATLPPTTMADEQDDPEQEAVERAEHGEKHKPGEKHQDKDQGKDTDKSKEKGKDEDELLLPAVPVLAYSRETSFLFGAMMVRAHRWEGSAPETRPNTFALSGFYSLEKQWAIGFAPSIYLHGDDYLVKAQIYQHRTPARFWGVGTDAGENGEREDFTATGTGVTFASTMKVFRSLRVGAGVWYGKARIPVKEPGGMLESDTLTGSDGGTDVGVELQAEWDDRDNIYAPTRGTYVQFWAGLHEDVIGSDFEYRDYLLDARHFIPLGSGQVLALQAKGRVMSGDPPFYRLPSIGGISVLRGLFDGRFRDKSMAAVQAEYRFPIWKSLGGALFAGVGEVAPDFGEFSFDALQYAGGGGLRLTLDPKERINLRLDVGFSQYGTFPIVVITEAF